MIKEALLPKTAYNPQPIKSFLKQWFWKGTKPLGPGGWEGAGVLTRGLGKPLVGWTLAGTLGSAATGHLQARSLVGDEDDTLSKTPVDETTVDRSPFVGAGVGAATAGLGALLYGKLKDQPDLRRDLIVTLIGGTLGASHELLKSGVDAADIEIYDQPSMLDKEALPALVVPALKTTAAIAAWLGGSHLLGASGRRDEERRHNEAIAEAKAFTRQQASLQRTLDITRRGTGGAILGTLSGATLSRLIGKHTGKDNLRRDVMSALGGALIGGAAGIYSA